MNSSRLACWVCLLCLAGRAAALPPTPETAEPVIHFGYTRSLVRNASENDFRSAMRAYSRLIAATSGIDTSSEPLIFGTGEEIVGSLANRKVDLVSGSAAEILTLPEGLTESPFLAATTGGALGAEYVLLVNEDSGLRRVADLAGRRLARLDSTLGVLIETWLDRLLQEENLPDPGKFFREIKPVAKPSLAALPVFFGQWEACIITTANLATLAELNPQLLHKLRPLAKSPRYVPILTAFRRSLDPGLRQIVMQNIDALGHTTNGRQILTLFQTDALQFCTETELLATRQLLSGRPLPAGTMNRLAPLPPPAP